MVKQDLRESSMVFDRRAPTKYVESSFVVLASIIGDYGHVLGQANSPDLVLDVVNFRGDHDPGATYFCTTLINSDGVIPAGEGPTGELRYGRLTISAPITAVEIGRNPESRSILNS